MFMKKAGEMYPYLLNPCFSAMYSSSTMDRKNKKPRKTMETYDLNPCRLRFQMDEE